MSFLKRLLGLEKVTAVENNYRTEDAVDYNYIFKDSGLICIPKLKFTGSSSYSPNGEYIVAWLDGDSTSGIGGNRKTGNGKVVLLEKGKVIFQTRELQRPNDGKVSNNGTFAVNDWLFTDSLKGRFFVFNAKGEILVNELFSANLYNNGISIDGKYAVVQTANSGSDHGGKLFFIDIENKKIMWSFVPQTRWANNYEFDINNQVVYLVFKSKHKYGYSFGGQFLDQGKWENGLVERAQSGYNLLYAAEIKLKKLKQQEEVNPSEYKEILSLCNQALKHNVSENTKATIYRKMGETQLLLNQTDLAIQDFETALELNPKVGVKKLLQQLKKSINK